MNRKNLLRMATLLVVVLLQLPALLVAGPVSEQRARSVAQMFVRQLPASRAGSWSLKLVYDGSSASRADGGAAPVFVYNNASGKGFVMVSAEDAVAPILAYSFASHFTKGNADVTRSSEGFAPGLVAWLGRIRKEVDWVRAHQPEPSKELRSLWEQATSRQGAVPVVQLTTANWDQQGVYAEKSFVMNGYLCPTGCVATSTAIVMRYHEWPECGVGTLPEYTYRIGRKRFRIPARPLGQPYHWKDMPLEYVPPFNATPATQEIASLMIDCGVMLKSYYTPGVTLSQNARIPEALATYMGYDKSIIDALRTYYTTAEWHALLQKNLQECGPVIYGGSDEAGNGHSFVLDGYTADGYYHTNWGWGGQSNGYYLLDVMKPDMPEGEFLDQTPAFTNKQDAVIGIRKDERGTYRDEIRLVKVPGHRHPYGLSSPDRIEKDVPFNFVIYSLANMGYHTIASPQLMVALTDASGRIKEKLDEFESEFSLEVGKGYRFQRMCTITTDFAYGDEIRLFHKRLDTNQWTLIRGNDEEGVTSSYVLSTETALIKLAGHIGFEYDRATDQVIWTMPELTTVKVTDSKGNDFSDRCQIANGKCIFPTKGLVLDRYVFTFANWNQEVQLGVKVGR